MNRKADFDHLTAELLIRSVEIALGRQMTGLIAPLPSYINRVYELQTADGARVIAKFYRPGRWTVDALKDEHDFVLDCAQDEIPVISPLTLSNGTTLGEVEGIFFAIFPKKFGREFEINTDEDWRRVGRLVARIHVAGKQKQASARIKLHPQISTAKDIHQLIDGGFIPPSCLSDFSETCMRIMDSITGVFEDVQYMRIHGDCHRGNLLHRPGEGIMVIDFDDMMTGPPIQDIWLLLPDYANRSRTEFDLVLQGYEQFREFDRKDFRLIEPLRAMRLIYYLAWCGKQSSDLLFRKNFPDWGSETFWKKEINDLKQQLKVILDHIPNLAQHPFNPA